jgi:streptogramin lyase
MRIPEESFMRVGLAVVVCGLVGLAGCSGGTFNGLNQTQVGGTSAGARLTGSVHGGQQPIAGAHVYLFAANTTGYGGLGIAASTSNASLSLLTSAGNTTQDSSGGATNGDYYVTTDGSGNFSITGDYTCAAGAQVYLYALGGNPGSGVNSAAGLMAALGNCPVAGNFATSTPFVMVNEVSTVAAAYAFAGFATDATHVGSSGTTLAQMGIANAFANAANLETLSTGVALVTTPAGNGTVPQAEINTLANVLAACVNSTGGACLTLLANAPSGGTTGTLPTDTATAAINIAHNPANNVAALYALASGTPPFAPGLSAAPNDWTIGLSFTAGGLNNSYGIAIDGSGNVWVANILGNCVTKLSPAGAALSGSSGFTDGFLNNPTGVALDGSGNAWITNDVDNRVVQLTSAGSASADPNGYATGTVPYAVAIDGSGDVWVANELSNNATELNGTTGAAVGSSPFGGGGQNLPYAIATDTSGSAWVVNYKGNNTTRISSTGVAASHNAGNQSEPDGVAVDASGSIWIANAGNNSLTRLSSTGATGSNYTGGGLKTPGALGIDGGGNVWLPNSGGNSLSEFSNSGNALTPSTGFAGGGLGSPAAAAVDGSGNVWVSNNSSSMVSEFVGAATPVVTPLAVGVKNNMLGTRP